MIEIATEKVVSLAQAAKHLPRRRKGKRPHVATLYRWTNEGCRGIRLEFTMCGATRCTSLEALQRFLDRLTEAADVSTPVIPPPLTTSRQRRIEAAERRLATSGISTITTRPRGTAGSAASVGEEQR